MVVHEDRLLEESSRPPLNPSRAELTSLMRIIALAEAKLPLGCATILQHSKLATLLEPRLAEMNVRFKTKNAEKKKK